VLKSSLDVFKGPINKGQISIPKYKASVPNKKKGAFCEFAKGEI